MKKIFLFVAAAALTVSLNSCSKDDDNGSSKSVSFKVDGVNKKFKVESAETAGTLFVTGYMGTAANPTETVFFTIESGATGADVMDNFSYNNANDDYSSTTLTSNVTSNSGGKAAGTFSGTLEPFDGDTNVVITEGKFSTK